MTTSFLIVLGIFIIFMMAVGCGFSDASWAIKKYIQGDKIGDVSPSSRERIFRAKLGADLLIVLCIFFGLAALFGGLIVAFTQY